MRETPDPEIDQAILRMVRRRPVSARRRWYLDNKVTPRGFVFDPLVCKVAWLGVIHPGL